MSTSVWVASGVLGAAGALIRATTAAVAAERFGVRFPWGTLAVNLVGAFALGLLHGSGVGGRTMILVGAALLGAMTTFSTWMLETLRLASTRPVAAAMNVGGQLVAGLALAALGNALGSLL